MVLLSWSLCIMIITTNTIFVAIIIIIVIVIAICIIVTTIVFVPEQFTAGVLDLCQRTDGAAGGRGKSLLSPFL